MSDNQPGLADLRITVDIVIYTIRDSQLQVLLTKRSDPPFEGLDVLPGGYMWEGETGETAVKRLLKEKTGVENVFVEQLYTFDAIDRDPRERVVSMAYFALVPEAKMQNLSHGAHLKEVYAHGKLGFDHNQIVDMAKKRMVSKLEYTNAAYSLLPKKFTLSELQSVYEISLNQTLDKRNFRKKILTLDMVAPTDEMQTGKKHRPARLYTFKKRIPHAFDSPFVWQ